MTTEKTRPAGLAAIDREMARQNADAIASFEAAADMAAKAAASLKRTSKLLLLGMGVPTPSTTPSSPSTSLPASMRSRYRSPNSSASRCRSMTGRSS